MRIMIQTAGDGVSFDLVNTTDPSAPLIATVYDWNTAVRIQVMLEAIADLPVDDADAPPVALPGRVYASVTPPRAPQPLSGPPPLPTDREPSIPFRPAVLGPSTDAEPVTAEQEKGDSPLMKR